MWIQKRILGLLKVFFYREWSFLSTPRGKFIQTISRVDHGSLRNKTAETCNFTATHTKCSLSLPATSQITYLATLVLTFSLCLSHIWCSKCDTFNKHVYKLVTYFWHYFCFFVHQTSFMGRKHINSLIVKWPFLLYCYEILQSMRISMALEIKPSISGRLTFCTTVRSEASSQGGVGGGSTSKHSLSQNDIRKSLWCISWPLDDSV